MSIFKDHLEISEENRDHNWDEKFFKLFSESNLSFVSEDPQQGPDGWPYLLTEISIDKINNSELKTDTAQKILNWLSTRGIGLVVNPRRTPYPDYVFSYGMIWSFRETGYFMRRVDPPAEVSDSATLSFGVPTQEYFPNYVRNIVRDFFRDQGVFEAKIIMISADPDKLSFDLCFSIESIGNPPEDEHEGILEALSWFFPPHYTLGLVRETDINGFVNL